MIKSTLKYILPAIAVLGAFGCTSDAVIDDIAAEEELVDVTFTTGNTVQSRFTDESFQNGDKIDIWLSNSDYTSLGEKKTFQYYNGSLNPVSGTFQKSPSEVLTYFAMTPGYTISGNKIIAYGGNNDILFSMAETADTDVLLPFAHFFGQMRIRVDNATRTVSKVELLNVNNRSVADFNDGSWTCDGGPSTVKMYVDSSDPEFPYYYYLPIMNYLPDMEVRVTYNNNESKIFEFKSDFGYIKENTQYLLSADMTPNRSNPSRSADLPDGVDGYIECIECIELPQ